ncbi:MAG: 4Fe-4S dicluster domain-containing protein, partial [Candidatus Hydrothermarchaeales archaeon]
MDNLIEALKSQVDSELKRCTECKKCLHACPIHESDEIAIEELNDATRGKIKPSGKIMDFAFDCMGCGACVPVCPEDLRRDRMMVQLRSKGKLPRGYNN